MTVNRLLWIAAGISVFAYSFWRHLWEHAFYPINALFIFMLSLVIYLQNRKLFISFFLLFASLGNLLDEAILENTTTSKYEIIFALTLPIIWYLKNLRDAGKIFTK